MRSNVMGIEHLDTADCINLLAMISKKEGDYDKAKELFLNAIAIVEKTLGTSHAKLAVYLRYVYIILIPQCRFVILLLLFPCLVIWVMLVVN